MLNDKREVETKTKNKIITYFAIEHTEAINGNISELQKINKVRKHKIAMLPYELFGSNEVTITSC